MQVQNDVFALPSVDFYLTSLVLRPAMPMAIGPVARVGLPSELGDGAHDESLFTFHLDGDHSLARSDHERGPMKVEREPGLFAPIVVVLILDLLDAGERWKELHVLELLEDAVPMLVVTDLHGVRRRLHVVAVAMGECFPLVSYPAVRNGD